MRPDQPRRWRTLGARTSLAAIIAIVLGAACTSLLAIKDPTLEDAGGGPSEAGAIDAAVDSSVDSPIDSAIDAGIDGAIDAPIDGPPAAECTAGVCCNTGTGKFEPTTKVCGTTTDFQCSPAASSCGGQPQSRTNQQFCSGDAATCTGRTVTGTFTNLGAACNANQLCVPQTGAAPQCSTCQFGCDSGATVCRAPKVFVYVTDAIFTGAFGATSGGRATADAKCQDKFNSAGFPTNGCALANVHAVIQVDDTLDTLARMATTFSIPTTAEVFRSVDPTTKVSGSWTSFVDPNAILLAPVSTGSSSIPFWSGRGLSSNHQCTNWTSTASVGDSGDAITVNKWTSQGATNCANLIPHLMCMCF